jgi:hypothetical protein
MFVKKMKPRLDQVGGHPAGHEDPGLPVNSHAGAGVTPISEGTWLWSVAALG